MKKLGGMKPLTLAAFKELITTVPIETLIDFAGLSEPFQNPECPDMILYAHQKGHKIKVSSTLTGLLLNDAMRLCEIPFVEFILHLPDSEGNAHIPITPNYQNTLTYILTHVSNIAVMNMGGKFHSNHVEDFARGKITTRKKGRMICAALEAPCYQLMPNGDVIFCCSVRGLTGKVGSLYESTYPELAAKHKKISLRLQKDPESFCHKCPTSNNYHIMKILKWKDRLLRGKNIIQTLSSIVYYFSP
jgi:hypothetical protein